MKCFWHTCLAVIVTATVASAANAQWNEPEQIGSYQTLLSRSGYGDQIGTRLTKSTPASYRNQDIPAPPGAAIAKQDSDPAANSVMAVPAGDFGTVTMDCGCGGVCGAPNCGGRKRLRGRVGGGAGAMNGCGSGGYVDGGAAAGCGGPVFDPDASAAAGIGNQADADVCGAVEEARDRGANWVFGVFGVSFRRDYEDNRRLGWNGAGTDLYTNDVENGNMNGMGFSIGRRGCSGGGWEFSYWGLDQEDDVTLAGPTYTYLTGLANVAHPPSGATVEDIFNAGDSVRVYRDTDINNLEFNLLRNGGSYTTFTGRDASYELFGGFRLFTFDESLRYVNFSSAPGYPSTLEYSLEAENSLTGFQLGGRSEVCLSDRFRFSWSGAAGVYNNYIETRQQIFDDTGYWAMNYTDTKNDAAFLGQMDLGLIYQFSQKIRARAGYRVMGVSGVALAEDQIPYDFTDTRALSSANSDGSLILYGWYYGGEVCF